MAYFSLLANKPLCCDYSKLNCFAILCFYVNREDVKIFNKKFKNIEDIIDDNSASENLKTFAKEKLKRLEISKRNSLQMACLLITVPLVYMFPFGALVKYF